jgi:hypothetical protein
MIEPMKFKSIDWNSAPALREGHAMIVSGGNLRSVAAEELDDLFDINPDLIVLADTPEAWKAYVRDRVREVVEWTLRHCVTLKDQEFLHAVGITWNSAPSPDFAPSPGHALVRGGNGALHHIPIKNVDRIGSVDPRASVLHIEPDPRES